MVDLAICMWCIIALNQSDCCQITALQPMCLTDTSGVYNMIFPSHFDSLCCVCVWSVCLLGAAESECSSEIHNNPAEGIIYNDCIWILSDTCSVTILSALPSSSIALCHSFTEQVWTVHRQSDGLLLPRGLGDSLCKSTDNVHAQKNPGETSHFSELSHRSFWDVNLQFLTSINQ